MRPKAQVRFFVFVLLLSLAIIPSSALAQSDATTDVAAAANRSVKSATVNSGEPTTTEEIVALTKQLAEQQKEIDQLRLLVLEHRRPVAGQSEVAGAGAPSGAAESQPGSVGATTRALPPTAAPA
jgi:hypothetical protein